MAAAWCICKTEAVALIGVPASFEGGHGVGSIAFNAHRLYGKIQLQHLFANWEQGANESKFIFTLPLILLHLKIAIEIGYANLTSLPLLFSVYTEAFENYDEHKYKHPSDAFRYEPIFIVRK